MSREGSRKTNQPRSRHLNLRYVNGYSLWHTFASLPWCSPLAVVSLLGAEAELVLERVKRRKHTPCSQALKLRYMNGCSSTPLPRSLPWCFAGGCVSAWWGRSRACSWTSQEKEIQRQTMQPRSKPCYVNGYSSTPLPRSLPWCSASGCVSAWWSRSRACSWTCRERETQGHPMPWPKPSLLKRLQLYTFAALPWCSASGCVSAWWSRRRAYSWTSQEKETQGHPKQPRSKPSLHDRLQLYTFASIPTVMLCQWLCFCLVEQKQSLFLNVSREGNTRTPHGMT